MKPIKIYPDAGPTHAVSDDSSIPSILEGIGKDAAHLLRDYWQLLQVELTQVTRPLGKVVAYSLIYVTLLMVTITMLSVGVALTLVNFYALPAWQAFLLCALVAGACAAAFYFAIKNIKHKFQKELVWIAKKSLNKTSSSEPKL